MSKKTIIIVLSVLVAAATAAIELLSSCSTGTIFHRVTPADSVYYERHVDVRPGSLSRVFPFSSLHHNVREELQKKSFLKRQKAESIVALALARQCDNPVGSFKRSALFSLNLFGTTRETDRRSALSFPICLSNFNKFIYV